VNCNAFLHKGVAVDSLGKNIRNNCLIVENFEYIFIMSIQGRAACVSPENPGGMEDDPGAMEADPGVMEVTWSRGGSS
jgi:hypothetical protein